MTWGFLLTLIRNLKLCFIHYVCSFVRFSVWLNDRLQTTPIEGRVESDLFVLASKDLPVRYEQNEVVWPSLDELNNEERDKDK